MDEIKVSVITPTHNMAGPLPESIQSVRNQTLKGVEHIVVDDGSTDETPAVVAAFGNSIVYRRIEQGGISRARNTALEMARGKTVMFLDADDLIQPQTLEILFNALNGRDETIVYGTTHDLWNQDGAWVSSPHPHGPHPPSGDPMHDILMRTWSLYPCAQLWPMVLVRRIGEFDVRCVALQDLDFLMRALLAGTRIEHVPGAVSLYRRHGSAHTSMSASVHRRDAFEARIYFAEKVESQLREQRKFEPYRIALGRFYYGLAMAHFHHHPDLSGECAERAWKLARWDSMPLSWPRRVLSRMTGFARYRRLARQFGSG